MKSEHALLLGVLMAIIVGGFLYMGLTNGTKFQIGGTSGGTGSTGGGVSTVQTCNADNQAQVRWNAFNAEDPTQNTYLPYASRIYSLDGTTESYVNSVTMSASDNTNTSLPCGVAYKIYLPATNASRTSGFITTPVITKPITLPDYKQTASQASVQFRVFDVDNNNFVYSDSGKGAAVNEAATTFELSGASFYSTTTNTTGTAVGSGGRISYKIYVETNATASAVTRFDDQELLMFSYANSTVYNPPVASYIEPSGGSLTSETVSAKSARLANDQYNYAWVVNLPHDGAGNVVHITDTPVHIFGFTVNAVTGQNPTGTDTVKVGFATSGYFQNTLGSGMSIGYNKDDTSKTYVYSPQVINLVVS